MFSRFRQPVFSRFRQPAFPRFRQPAFPRFRQPGTWELEPRESLEPGTRTLGTLGTSGTLGTLPGAQRLDGIDSPRSAGRNRTREDDDRDERERDGNERRGVAVRHLIEQIASQPRRDGWRRAPSECQSPGFATPPRWP